MFLSKVKVMIIYLMLSEGLTVCHQGLFILLGGLFPYLITWNIFLNLIKDSLNFEQLLAKLKICVFLLAFCFYLDSQAGSVLPFGVGGV